MIVKLLTEHHMEFLGLKKAAQARLSLHMSKCHIVGNLMSRLTCLVLLQATIQAVPPSGTSVVPLHHHMPAPATL